MKKLNWLLIIFILVCLFFIAWAAWGDEIIILDPPPDGYKYVPEEVNIGGEVYWIANILVKIKPTIWNRAKEEISWVIGIGGTILAGLGGLLIRFGVLKLPGRKR